MSTQHPLSTIELWVVDAVNIKNFCAKIHKRPNDRPISITMARLILKISPRAFFTFDPVLGQCEQEFSQGYR